MIITCGALCKALKSSGWFKVSTQHVLPAITSSRVSIYLSAVLFFFDGLQKVGERSNAEDTQREEEEVNEGEEMRGRGSRARKYKSESELLHQYMLQSRFSLGRF